MKKPGKSTSFSKYIADKKKSIKGDLKDSKKVLPKDNSENTPLLSIENVESTNNIEDLASPVLEIVEIAKVTMFAQYIIDRIRARRFELGISARELSKRISEYEPPLKEAYVLISNIGSIYSSNRYTLSSLKKAVYHLNFAIKDILPSELLDNDALQEKTQISIINGMSAKAALTYLLEEGYFDIGRDRHEITEYCNAFYSDKEMKKTKDFTSALEELNQKGIVIRIAPDKEKGEKQSKFQKNPNYESELDMEDSELNNLSFYPQTYPQPPIVDFEHD